MKIRVWNTYPKIISFFFFFLNFIIIIGHSSWNDKINGNFKKFTEHQMQYLFIHIVEYRYFMKIISFSLAYLDLGLVMDHRVSKLCKVCYFRACIDCEQSLPINLCSCQSSPSLRVKSTTALASCSDYISISLTSWQTFFGSSICYVSFILFTDLELFNGYTAYTQTTVLGLPFYHCIMWISSVQCPYLE